MGEQNVNTQCGLEEHVAGTLCYVLGFITGIVFFLIEKENEFVRFHAVQSIIVFGGLFVLNIILSILGVIVVAIPVLGPIMSMLIGLLYFLIIVAGLVAWILLMVKAYQGEKYKLPIAGDYAVKYAAK